MPSTILGEHATTIPVGTTAQRPGTPTAGMLRFNTTTGYLEYYNVATTSWLGIGQLSVSGGTGTTYTDGGTTYGVAAFTSSGSLSIINGGTMDIVAVGGGGGGGSWVPGGGGAGGLVSLTGQYVSGGTYSAVVGSGGPGQLNPGNYSWLTGIKYGGDSYIALGSSYVVNAMGGGLGGSYDGNGGDSNALAQNGGSGGGRGISSASNGTGLQVSGSGVTTSPNGNAVPATSLTAGFGNNGGGNGSSNEGYGQLSGGGAGGAPAGYGSNNGGMNGRQVAWVGTFNQYGTNTSNSTSGTRGYFCGGGGQGNHSGGPVGSGGYGGGGTGSSAMNSSTPQSQQPGLANTGGGGGGGGMSGGQASRGGTGGSGLLLVRYIAS
jgi:hypothetical protein